MGGLIASQLLCERAWRIWVRPTRIDAADRPSMYNPPISGKPSIQHGHEMRRFAEQDADVDPMAYPSPYNNGLKPKRDHRGNLPGGKQNGELQKYQMCETLEEKEHKRWLAHKDAALAATFPKSLELNGINIPIFKLQELETINGKILKQRALNMRDLITATKSRFFDEYPDLQLNPHSPEVVLHKWFIDVQVRLAQATGWDDLDHAAFGATTQPALWERAPELSAAARQQRAEPAWSQHGINDGKQPGAPSGAPFVPSKTFQGARAGMVFKNGAQGVGYYADALRARDAAQVPARDFPWSQHEVARNDDRPRSGALQGFSLVPPHLQSGGNDMMGGRFDDAAHIRYRGHSSSFVMG